MQGQHYKNYDLDDKTVLHRYIYLVCLGFSVELENFSLMETSPILVKGCKF